MQPLIYILGGSALGYHDFQIANQPQVVRIVFPLTLAALDRAREAIIFLANLAGFKLHSVFLARACGDSKTKHGIRFLVTLSTVDVSLQFSLLLEHGECVIGGEEMVLARN